MRNPIKRRTHTRYWALETFGPKVFGRDRVRPTVVRVYNYICAYVSRNRNVFIRVIDENSRYPRNAQITVTKSVVQTDPTES